MARSGKYSLKLPRTGQAKLAYGDFLSLWKNADSDVPILGQAKAEYARLQ